jgi:hypothetical protein
MAEKEPVTYLEDKQKLEALEHDQYAQTPQSEYVVDAKAEKRIL